MAFNYGDLRRRLGMLSGYGQQNQGVGPMYGGMVGGGGVPAQQVQAPVGVGMGRPAPIQQMGQPAPVGNTMNRPVGGMGAKGRPAAGMQPNQGRSDLANALVQMMLR
jgi:hypothetical protein